MVSCTKSKYKWIWRKYRTDMYDGLASCYNKFLGITPSRVRNGCKRVNNPKKQTPRIILANENQ